MRAPTRCEETIARAREHGIAFSEQEIEQAIVEYVAEQGASYRRIHGPPLSRGRLP